MPIYEYACTNCGERTEARQSFTDLPLETCEICGGKLRKLYSPVGVLFKGTGFYSTDARKPAASTGSSSESSKSDTKADKKAGSKSASGGDAKGSAPAKSE
jgi:putative FmdB family regulatory protein